MTKEIIVTIGKLALKQMARNASSWHAFGHATQWQWQADKLRNEVDSGKTILMESANGEVERVVSVIALNICNTS
eukprot:4035627-Heterocapsa_arctica.AAC.1